MSPPAVLMVCRAPPASYPQAASVRAWEPMAFSIIIPRDTVFRWRKNSILEDLPLSGLPD